MPPCPRTHSTPSGWLGGMYQVYCIRSKMMNEGSKLCTGIYIDTAMVASCSAPRIQRAQQGLSHMKEGQGRAWQGEAQAVRAGILSLFLL